MNPYTQFGGMLMTGGDPRGEGLGGLGRAIVGTGANIVEKQRFEEESERARRLADLQAQTFQAKMAQQGQPDLSKTPTYIFNPATGQMEILQLSATGAPVQTQLPEGFQPALPLTYQDVGPAVVGMQRGATQPAVVLQKGLTPEAMPETRAAQAAAVQQAKATQAAREELPGAETTATRTLRYVDELKGHPGLEAGTGLSSMFPVVPGSDRADFEARKNQLLGGVFLEAYKTLKGGGQITEVEGKKAEQAMARIDAATSREDFVEALEDYQDAVRTGMEKLRKRAGGATPVPPPPPGFVVE